MKKMLWLGWAGVALSFKFPPGFMGTVCAAWFLINLVCIYLHQRRVAARWNMIYEPEVWE